MHNRKKEFFPPILKISTITCCLISLMTYQPLMGYLMPKFDTDYLYSYIFKYSNLILNFLTELFDPKTEPCQMLPL